MPGMMPGGPMAVPGAPYGIEPMTGLPYSDKQKMTAGLLQIFLGSFGVGRFYTGHTGIAIAQIAVSWLTCGVGTLWPLIDGIMMLTGKVTDAQGRPLRD
jgi:TM2 domain-containing membrane protein YozV